MRRARILQRGGETGRHPGWGGKITPDHLQETLDRFPRGLVKSVQPGALSLSQATEAGTVYWRGEVGELCGIAHSAGVGVHMDGARFANAIVARRFHRPT